MSVVLLQLHEDLPVLLYFWSVTIMLTADPNIKTCLLDSSFGADPRSGRSDGALWHLKQWMML